MVAARLANMSQGNFSKAANLPVSAITQAEAGRSADLPETPSTVEGVFSSTCSWTAITSGRDALPKINLRILPLNLANSVDILICVSRLGHETLYSRFVKADADERATDGGAAAAQTESGPDADCALDTRQAQGEFPRYGSAGTRGSGP